MAATVSLIQSLFSGLVVPSTGVALASGICRFYQPNTLTPQNVYSDNAGTAPITSLVLTSTGTGIAYTQNPVRMQVKDATDTNILYDVNVNTCIADDTYVKSSAFNGGTETLLSTLLNGWTTSAGGSAGLWKYKKGNTERNLVQAISDISINVKDYGAAGDNATDDTTAIQNAINAAISAAATLIFPLGTYRITSALSVSGAGLKIEGNNSTISQVSTTANGIGIAATTVFICSNLGIIGGAGAGSSGVGISITGSVSQFLAYNVQVLAFRTGISESASATQGAVVLGGIILADGNAAAVCVSGGFNYGAFIGVNVDTRGSGKCFSVSANNALIISHCRLQNGSGGTAGTGIAITAAATVSVVGCHSNNLTTDMTIANAAIVLENLSPTLSNITDSRAGTPCAFNPSTTTSVTPLPAQSKITKIKETGSGTTLTINNPTGTFDFGFEHTIVCSNASGGAVTWTFGAAYKTSGAVAPATGNRITLQFYYDPVDATWSEKYRSASVPN